MVIIDTINFKSCTDCGGFIVPRKKKNSRICKDCENFNKRVKYLGQGWDYYRRIPRLHFLNGGYDDIVGCTQQEFKDYIESKFETWMHWKNRPNPYAKIRTRKTTWDLDHIIPWHTAKTDKEKRKLCHYKNIQPLCSYENRYVKSGKYTEKK